MTSFDEFSELVVSYLRNKIQVTKEYLSLVGSKRTKIWEDWVPSPKTEQCRFITYGMEEFIG